MLMPLIIVAIVALPWLLAHLACGLSAAGLAWCQGRNAAAWLVASLLFPFLPALWLTRRPPRGVQALSACDTCWYSMERDVNPMMVVGFMFMRKAPERAALAAVLEERLLCFDRFRQVPGRMEGHLTCMRNTCRKPPTRPSVTGWTP